MSKSEGPSLFLKTWCFLVVSSTVCVLKCFWLGTEKVLIFGDIRIQYLFSFFATTLMIFSAVESEAARTGELS
jgi:hypothetical protein